MIVEVGATSFGPGHRGGGERHFQEFARELGRRTEVRASFALPAGEPDPFGGSLVLPARFGNLPPFVTGTNPLPRPASIRRVREFLTAHAGEIEFVHVHNLRTAVSTEWLLIARLLRDAGRYRVLLTDHGARFAPLPRFTARLVDYYAPVSGLSDRQLQALAPRPSRIVPTAVSAEFLADGPLSGWGERDIDLLCAGRIVPWKRADRAVRLAERVRAAHGRSPRLVVAGAPERPDYLAVLKERIARSPAAGSIELRVGPTDAELRALYRRARFLLALSATTDSFGHRYPAPELSGIAILEAAAAGVPALISELPVLQEQIRPGETGRVLPEADDGAAAEAISRALDDPAGWERMSGAARRYVEQDRTYPAIAARFVAFLDDIRAGRA